MNALTRFQRSFRAGTPAAGAGGARGRRIFLKAAGLGIFGVAAQRLQAQVRGHEGPAWFPLEDLYRRIRRLGREHGDFLKLEDLGRSVQGRPLVAVRLSDWSVSGEHKEHVLLTTLHSGGERIGPSAMLEVVEWLLSGHPLARRILARQQVVCVPIVNPDGYVAGSFHNAHDLDPYNNWTLEGPVQPEKHPEARVIQRLMDELQPEVHGDMHGSFLEFYGSIHADTAAAYSNVSLRPYHHEIMRLMNEAALEEGYPADWLEEDSERMFWGPDLDGMREKTWKGRPRVYAATYCYNRYHSLVTANENAWERSALLRYRRLLQVGNEVWPGEYYPGYPTRVMMGNDLHRLTAYGTTAGARRRSRVELWNKLRQLSFGFDWPEVEGMALCVCATSREAARKWLGDHTLLDMLSRIERHPGMNLEPIRRLVHGHPLDDGKRPARFLVEGGGAKFYRQDSGPDRLEAGEGGPVRHGICVRLRIPYQNARILDLRLNGHVVDPSETDGFVTWVARGFAHVQVAIPPRRTRAEEIFLVTCEYDPRERRRQGKVHFAN